MNLKNNIHDMFRNQLTREIRLGLNLDKSDILFKYIKEMELFELIIMRENIKKRK